MQKTILFLLITLSFISLNSHAANLPNNLLTKCYQEHSKLLNNKNIESTVVLFTANWCPYCKQAEKHLISKNIDFIKLDIDQPDAESLFACINGIGVPTITVGTNTRLDGFKLAQLDQAIAESTSSSERS